MLLCSTISEEDTAEGLDDSQDRPQGLLSPRSVLRQISLAQMDAEDVVARVESLLRQLQQFCASTTIYDHYCSEATAAFRALVLFCEKDAHARQLCRNANVATLCADAVDSALKTGGRVFSPSPRDVARRRLASASLELINDLSRFRTQTTSLKLTQSDNLAHARILKAAASLWLQAPSALAMGAHHIQPGERSDDLLGRCVALGATLQSGRDFAEGFLVMPISLVEQQDDLFNLDCGVDQLHTGAVVYSKRPDPHSRLISNDDVDNNNNNNNDDDDVENPPEEGNHNFSDINHNHMHQCHTRITTPAQLLLPKSNTNAGKRHTSSNSKSSCPSSQSENPLPSSSPPMILLSTVWLRVCVHLRDTAAPSHIVSQWLIDLVEHIGDRRLWRLRARMAVAAERQGNPSPLVRYLDTVLCRYHCQQGPDQIEALVPFLAEATVAPCERPDLFAQSIAAVAIARKFVLYDYRPALQDVRSRLVSVLIAIAASNDDAHLHAQSLAQACHTAVLGFLRDDRNEDAWAALFVDSLDLAHSLFSWRLALHAAQAVAADIAHEFHYDTMSGSDHDSTLPTGELSTPTAMHAQLTPALGPVHPIINGQPHSPVSRPPPPTSLSPPSRAAILGAVRRLTRFIDKLKWCITDGPLRTGVLTREATAVMDQLIKVRSGLTLQRHVFGEVLTVSSPPVSVNLTHDGHTQLGSSPIRNASGPNVNPLTFQPVLHIPSSLMSTSSSASMHSISADSIARPAPQSPTSSMNRMSMSPSSLSPSSASSATSPTIHSPSNFSLAPLPTRICDSSSRTSPSLPPLPSTAPSNAAMAGGVGGSGRRTRRMSATTLAAQAMVAAAVSSHQQLQPHPPVSLDATSSKLPPLHFTRTRASSVRRHRSRPFD